MRTVLIFQAAMALMAVAPVGPSKSPQPWAQAYSLPDLFTPTRRTVCPDPSTNRFPDTATDNGTDAAINDGESTDATIVPIRRTTTTTAPSHRDASRRL